MNTQRWLALAFLVVVIACIVSSRLWLPGLLLGSDADLTPTPTVQGEDQVFASTAPVKDDLSLTSTPTLDPVVAELLAEAQMDTLGVGDKPFVIFAGDFTVIDSLHRGEGVASIYRLGDLRNVLRLDPFEVTTGPDLHVILSNSIQPRTSADALLPEYVDLGPLKNTSGAQNYDIPEGLQIERYRSVVIFSMSLKLVYTSAPLDPVRGSQ